ncbi:FUSC family protein [Pseudomonas xionganensis]|uniref:FUSC family protein n=1 Tax=Pseudomonas xionganensis TaxID=2654845 RepID=A0A6I4L170_9PSED|nr:FUSC family protein [Pseudomonas xionganensis]MVW75753.1 FUSC family protein [Pseudomonas xionganensis]
MTPPQRSHFRWHPGPPAWGSAMIAGLGCALPLLLGLFSAHPGFLWAALGAFQAAQANPLHRLGMLRMLMFCALGASSVALGFWAASHAYAGILVFALFGFLLAWLQRYGSEAGKLGISLAICLCIGQGQEGLGSLNNPAAIAMLFILGGLWVMLLAFGMRGLHGLRMWPYMPRFISIFKVLRRYAKRLPQQQWRLHALSCTLAFALAGLIVNLANLERGYWLTLIVVSTLQLDFQGSLVRALQSILVSVAIAGLLILLGYSLQDPATLVAILLPLIALCRGLQANHYGLFVLQIGVCFILLADSLALDWDNAEMRLLNALFGVVLALFITLLEHGLRQLPKRHAPRVDRQSKQ